METNRPIPDIEYVLALLQFIRNRGEVRSLLKATGNDIDRLCHTIDKLKARGYVVSEERQLIITDSGREYLQHLNNKLGRKGLYSYFIPDYSVRKVRFDITTTYIPQYMIKRGGNNISNSLVLGRPGELSGDNEPQFKRNK